MKEQEMTQDDLDALPDVSPRIDRVEKIIDGKRVICARQVGGFALFIDDDCGMVRDSNGIKWTVGYHNGEKVKQRCMSQDTY
jgi:hypothetical protein